MPLFPPALDNCSHSRMAIKSTLSSVSVLGVARLARVELSDVVEAASSAGVIGFIMYECLNENEDEARQEALRSSHKIYA